MSCQTTFKSTDRGTSSISLYSYKPFAQFWCFLQVYQTQGLFQKTTLTKKHLNKLTENTKKWNLFNKRFFFWQLKQMPQFQEMLLLLKWNIAKAAISFGPWELLIVTIATTVWWGLIITVFGWEPVLANWITLTFFILYWWLFFT